MSKKSQKSAQPAPPPQQQQQQNRSNQTLGLSRASGQQAAATITTTTTGENAKQVRAANADSSREQANSNKMRQQQQNQLQQQQQEPNKRVKLEQREDGAPPKSGDRLAANQDQKSSYRDEAVAAAAAAANICAACQRPIRERYLLMALEKRWHEDCLKCACCECRLGEVGSSLFTHSGKLLCRRDFLRIFGQQGHCAACNRPIPPYELVMRAQDKAYHLDCFACQQCQYRFCVGDRFHLTEAHKIICVHCHSEQQQQQRVQEVPNEAGPTAAPLAPPLSAPSLGHDDDDQDARRQQQQRVAASAPQVPDELNLTQLESVPDRKHPGEHQDQPLVVPSCPVQQMHRMSSGGAGAGPAQKGTARERACVM